jgi:predicted DNA-binding transcriptional regulator AlpA
MPTKPSRPHADRPTEATAPPQLLSHEDLSRFYGIAYSRQHLWRLIRAGVLPRPVALGIGKFARKAFRREDIEAYVASLSYVGGAGKAA